MSKYVKISLLGQRPLTAPYTDDLESLVNGMINYLKFNLDKVLPDKPDLIVLAEACDRYPNFTMDQRKTYYNYRGDRIRDWLSEVAAENHCYIAYSAARCVPSDTKYPYRNSTQIIGRDGKIVGIYDKNHLVIAENTEGGIAYGNKAEVFELDFGRVACAICFDLNFDELLLKYVPQKPNLIIFSSMYHGGMKQFQWAYQCEAYFAGAICGQECRILNPFGETAARSTNYYDFVTGTVNMDYVLAHIDHNNPRFKAAKQKYGDGFIMHDPGYVGAVLLTCERDDMTIMDIVKEFDIELLDDYFNRSLKHRHDNVIY